MYRLRSNYAEYTVCITVVVSKGRIKSQIEDVVVDPVVEVGGGRTEGASTPSSADASRKMPQYITVAAPAEHESRISTLHPPLAIHHLFLSPNHDELLSLHSSCRHRGARALPCPTRQQCAPRSPHRYLSSLSPPQPLHCPQRRAPVSRLFSLDSPKMISRRSCVASVARRCTAGPCLRLSPRPSAYPLLARARTKGRNVSILMRATITVTALAVRPVERLALSVAFATRIVWEQRAPLLRPASPTAPSCPLLPCKQKQPAHAWTRQLTARNLRPWIFHVPQARRRRLNPRWIFQITQDLLQPFKGAYLPQYAQ